MKLLLGIDIGGTKIGIGLGDESGRLLGSSYKDNRDTDPAEVLPWIVSEANRLASSAGMDKLLDFYAIEAEKNGTVSPRGIPKACKLSDAQYNAVEAVLEREVSSQLQELETRIGLLATLVSLSPYCGLFGTVWGVMMAFCGLAIAGNSNFSALAPGVAGALLTTVAGLVVAIPSLVGYNVLNSSIRALTTDLDNFAEGFMAQLKLEQVGSGPADHGL